MTSVARLVAPIGLAALLGVATLYAAPSVPDRFVDVLDRPAQPSALAPQRLLQATAVAGDRLVAAGARGHIVLSDDGGATWRQARVPVSADLTALHFADAREGWAVGHEGVVLHTGDGGASWELQLDGRRANALALAKARELAAADPVAHERLLAEAERAYEEGPSRPFLDVWFADAREGWAVGAYNLVFHTADGVYAAGELGLALKLDPASGRFVALATGYDGSWFGVLTRPGLALAYGLRGTAHRSLDGGATWTPVATGVTASLTSGQVLADGRLLLCSQAGDVLVGDADATAFRRVPLATPTSCAGIAAAGDALVVSGPRGVRVERAPF